MLSFRPTMVMSFVFVHGADAQRQFAVLGVAGVKSRCRSRADPRRRAIPA